MEKVLEEVEGLGWKEGWRCERWCKKSDMLASEGVQRGEGGAVLTVKASHLITLFHLCPERLCMRFFTHRYGENPHQPAAFYQDASLREFGAGGVATSVVHWGKEMSYNNYLVRRCGRCGVGCGTVRVCGPKTLEI